MSGCGSGVSSHDSKRDSPSRPPLKGRSARATEDVDVERSRGDGCELERSAASGDERNRPWRRPRDDNIKKDRKDKEDREAILPKIRLTKKTKKT
jgi:hypothetical protein